MRAWGEDGGGREDARTAGVESLGSVRLEAADGISQSINNCRIREDGDGSREQRPSDPRQPLGTRAAGGGWMLRN